MLRVGIIGCGKIADQHVEHIVHIPGCEIVAVCDNDELMARQLQERLGGIVAAFTDIPEMIEKARPDVVHITAPPQAHLSIGRMCLEAGCHIYVEKPFTVTHEEAEELIAVAERTNRRLTVGHDAQFSQAANRARALVAQGYLGGPPVHLEAYYCYNMNDATYARALFGDKQHWARHLPGGLLQNTISHGISKVAEYLTGDRPSVIAFGFTSQLLRSVGETSIVDELRTIISDGTTTAYFTFSSQMKPSLHMLRLYGPVNAVIVDEEQQTVIKVRGSRHKSYLEQFVPPWAYARQYAANGISNVYKFARNEFHGGYGKQFLIDAFYRSIVNQEPVPIPYSEILRTSRIMEDIFVQVREKQNSGQQDATPGPAETPVAAESPENDALQMTAARN